MISPALPRAAAAPRPRRSLLQRLLAVLVRQDGAARARHRLLLLEPHLLRDIGLTAEEAAAMAQAREWDAPAHWKS